MKIKSEENKCGNVSCGCATAADAAIDAQKNIGAESEEGILAKEKPEEKKLDPTHFGDWQINGRAIDF